MSNPEASPVICWVDLETTGSTPDDRIIEVGMVLTDRQLNPIVEAEWVVKPWPINHVPVPVVLKMHEANGLWKDVDERGRPIEEVDAEMASLLGVYAGTRHVPLAGSGVGHFDRAFIRREMPQTDKHLAYWTYDVGVVRRFLRLAGRPDTGHKVKLHRGLSDVHEHIEEAREYLALLAKVVA